MNFLTLYDASCTFLSLGCFFIELTICLTYYNKRMPNYGVASKFWDILFPHSFPLPCDLAFSLESHWNFSSVGINMISPGITSGRCKFDTPLF